MALGGGGFTSFNKILPGTYMNFVSSGSTSANVSDRGICAVGMELSWGKEGEFVTVSADQFLTDSVKMFGYTYSASKMRNLRDLFLNASKVHIYRLGEGVKATSDLAEAKYSGVCGNNISVKVGKNIDDESCFDVTTFYNGGKKDVQKVKSAEELNDNDFVTWKKSATLSAGTLLKLTGGADATVTGEDYQKFLDCAESVSFNVLCVASMDESVNNLVAAYTVRMREERGVKFQSVLYNTAYDSIGVVNVATSANALASEKCNLVWFVAGALAGCEINKSITNKVYNGSYKVSGSYTQSQLEEAIREGKFVIHYVDGEYRILKDINSFVSVTADMGEAFCENQTVRVLDQIANDDAYLFKTKYLGQVPNDEAGRISLWNDITEHRKTLQKMRAIENFKDTDVTVEKGNSKTSVVVSGRICPVNAMNYLYITTEIE